MSYSEAKKVVKLARAFHNGDHRKAQGVLRENWAFLNYQTPLAALNDPNLGLGRVELMFELSGRGATIA